MIRRGRSWSEISASEWRGFLVVMSGILALSYYIYWWVTQLGAPSPWIVATFLFAVTYCGIQILGNWALYLATHWRDPFPMLPIPEDKTVDVFLTACGEPPELVERALLAAVNMRGSHQTWLLDDGDDPRLAQLAQRLGAGYLVRNGRNDAKAGNVNAALAKTSGDIVVIFDIDHAPRPDFLERTLGYFRFPRVGFVQVMLTFENQADGWVAAAAADSTLDFYNPTSIGSDGLQSTTLIGSNAIIRRKALEEIGGYKPGLAEDLATSIALHAAGWRSAYVPEPLAPGYAPPDLPAWFTQQLKWARGVFELLLTAYPHHYAQLPKSKRVAYAVRMTYYWIGPVVFLHLLATIVALFSQNGTTLANFQGYLEHLLPFGAVVVLIRQLALRRWRHQSFNTNYQIKPMVLVFGSWPVYTLAWAMALLRIPLGFRLTPKSHSKSLNLIWLLPQTAVSILLIVGLAKYLANPATFSWLVLGFAGGALGSHLLLIGQWLWLARAQQSRKDLLTSAKRRAQKKHLPQHNLPNS
ncbi:MAG: glycosyltransferase [Ardenticatenaceae bacterium]|nr:glycosyltransferase [Anaerolineales bacterium]MCB8939576.1 glycosyltransferase [Ardenticatenaceae bacterium]MCB8974999.1 glycosyltransferase [Ardenticatenaceae bacterium]